MGGVGGLGEGPGREKFVENCHATSLWSPGGTIGRSHSNSGQIRLLRAPGFVGIEFAANCYATSLWSPGGPIGRSRSNSGIGLLAVELSLVIG